MKILDAGHRYLISSIDGGMEQELVFVKRENDGCPFNAGSNPGTNCQEVLRVLIDRIDYLQRQRPCAESEAISGLLKTALFLFEVRAARNRESIFYARDLLDCVRLNPCDVCGHVNCQKHA